MRRTDNDAVLSRAFRVLGAFSPQRAELTLDELAEASGLPRSTTHRLARQLAAVRALEPSRRGWRLGLRLFELGQLVPHQERLRDLALAHMEDLYELTHETVQLAVLDGHEVLYVEILSGHRKAPTPSRRGGRMPLHCTALGKILLAFSADRGAALLEAIGPLIPRTANTITDVARLTEQLAEARSSGLAFDFGESSPALQCAAAPVLARDGTARAALSVSMGVEGPLGARDIASAVQVSALALTRELRTMPIVI